MNDVPRYRSTGEPAIVPREEKATPMRRHEMRQAGWADREAKMEAIVESRKPVSPSEAHDKAVDAFDYANRDLMANPNLAQEVLRERNRIAEEAARSGLSVDWNAKLAEVGDTVRQRAGRPTTAEQERSEYFSAQRKARGLEG